MSLGLCCAITCTSRCHRRRTSPMSPYTRQATMLYMHIHIYIYMCVSSKSDVCHLKHRWPQPNLKSIFPNSTIASTWPQSDSQEPSLPNSGPFLSMDRNVAIMASPRASIWRHFGSNQVFRTSTFTGGWGDVHWMWACLQCTGSCTTYGYSNVIWRILNDMDMWTNLYHLVVQHSLGISLQHLDFMTLPYYMGSSHGHVGILTGDKPWQKNVSC